LGIEPDELKREGSTDDRLCSMKPDIDYETRDRDGRAVCVYVVLRLPGVGRVRLDPTPDDGLDYVPADPGLRLSPRWLPDRFSPARVLPG
jgi:hypothetical protein